MSAQRGRRSNSNNADANPASVSPSGKWLRACSGSLRRFIFHDDAATAVEYAVMLALILLAVIGSVFAVGTQTSSRYVQMDADMMTHGLGS